MGLFSAISNNLYHGGVKLTADTPGSISVQDAQLPITVTLTSSEAATINSVKAELLAQPLNTSVNSPVQSPDQLSQQQNQMRILAFSQLDQPFTMAAGETKTLQINIAMSPTNFAAGMLDTPGTMMNTGAYTYTVHVVADVAGVALNPSDSRGISVNSPGQSNTTFGFRL